MTEELTLEMTCSMTLSMEKQLTSCLFLTSSSQTKHVYNLFSGKFAYLAKDQIFIKTSLAEGVSTHSRLAFVQETQAQGTH